MKIDTLKNPTVFETDKAEKTKGSQDPFALDLKISQIRFGSPMPINELITSKSLCTPGCGNTGTNNSFCC